MLTRLLTRGLLLSLLISTSNWVLAEESEEESKEKKPELLYFAVNPKTLTFYQNTGRKIKYVVVEVQLAVRGEDKLGLVEDNLPLIQDALVDFFNSQDKQAIEDLKQRNKLREEAKNRVAEVLKEETGQDLIEDLLFTDYLYQ